MKEKEVEQSDYGTADHPDILTSGGLGPCIAIGLIHAGRAYMLHSPLLHYEARGTKHGFFTLLEEAVPRGDRDHVKVVLTGTCLDADDEFGCNDHTVKAREFAVTELSTRGFTNLYVRWSPPGCMAKLDLHTTGQIAHVEFTPWSDEGPELVDQDMIQL